MGEVRGADWSWVPLTPKTPCEALVWWQAPLTRLSGPGFKSDNGKQAELKGQTNINHQTVED